MEQFVYISGALTNVEGDDLKRFYEDLAEICKELGFGAYVPHIFAGPQTHPNLSPYQVDVIDRTAVTSSCLVVSYIGMPSLGTGIEIEMAHHANKPVILIYEEQKFKDRKISRLPLGSPAVIKHITFTSTEDALKRFKIALEDFIEKRKNSVLPKVLLNYSLLIRM